MKNINRLVLVVMLLALLIPTAVNAQDEPPQPQPNALVSSGIYLLTAQNGTFEDNGDETYTLTLQSVSQTMTQAVAAPVMSLQTVNTASIMLYWEANPDVSTAAVLEVGGVNVQLTLNTPTYDEAGVVTYQAAIEAILDPENTKDPELPMDFEGVTLSIAWSLDFQNGLFGEGANEPDSGGVRPANQECADAKTALKQKNQQIQNLAADVNRLWTTDCQNNVLGACDAYNAALAQYNTLVAEAAQLQAFVSSVCP